MAVVRLVNGKGITTISKASKVTVCLFIHFCRPLGQSAFNALRKCKINWPCFTEMNIIIFNIEGDLIPRFQMKQFPHRLRDIRLILLSPSLSFENILFYQFNQLYFLKRR